ncbi:MAG TPA: SMC-Scp complex subunit ScpB [Opitutales bacterium]|jgi:segregation and condensation protein B|nr:SMC-Scp complex subunit ScpB [Opitutales bacterium]
MEFNLKKILRAMLLSTSEPLSIKDIQEVITRYHEEIETSAEDPVEGSDAAPATIEVPASVIPTWPAGTETVENPVPTGQEVMQDLMAEVPTLLTATQIREAMDSIALELESNGDICRLVQGPSGFRLTVAPEYADWVRLLRDAPKPLKLSQAALETLALIAYRQPITRAEIEAVRGVAVDSALNRLLELELVFVSGRADLPGRPIQYASTPKFLEFCGIQSLEELPATDVVSPAQLNEWIRRAIEPEGEQQLLSDGDVGLPVEEPAAVAQADAQHIPAS